MSGFLFVAPCCNPRLTEMNRSLPFALAFSYFSTENLRRMRRNFSTGYMEKRSLA
jgi:hypothetical protein